MKSDSKADLARELALEAATPPPDVGVRAGSDPFHAVFRSRPVINFTSWDLLEAQQHKEVKVVAVRAIEEYGAFSSSGRFVGGLTAAHTACEARLARFFGAESSLLFASKTQAAFTLITSLCGEGVVVLGSVLNPLPLADSCALVGADFVEFEGEDELRKSLERYKLAKRIVVVCEATSSITGSSIDAPRIAMATEQAGAWLIIDETSAIGYSGLRGAGSAETVPTSPALVARLVGASVLGGGEACGVVGTHELRELLMQRSRYIRIDAAPSPVAAAVIHRALDLVEVGIAQRKRLVARCQLAHAAVRAQGWSVVGGVESPILSLWFDTHARAREVQDGLLQRGILVDALPARSLRKSGAVVRIILSNGHSEEEFQALLEGLLEIHKRSASVL